MSWHKEGEGSYFYRGRWVNGRSVREYYGSGIMAHAAATADTILRVDKELQTRAWQRVQSILDAALEPLVELGKVTDLLAKAAMYAANYHQCGYKWRRKRVSHRSR